MKVDFWIAETRFFCLYDSVSSNIKINLTIYSCIHKPYHNDNLFFITCLYCWDLPYTDLGFFALSQKKESYCDIASVEL